MVAEFLLAGWLFSGIRLLHALGVAVGLLVIFSAWFIHASLLSAEPVPCGCGLPEPRAVEWWPVTRNGLLIAGSLGWLMASEGRRLKRASSEREACWSPAPVESMNI